MPDKILVSLGGNALVKAGQRGTLQEQTANLSEWLPQLVEMIREGDQLVITHGNGPQVGHNLIRVEEARHKAYELPLDVCVAQSQGEIGYLIQAQLHNLLCLHQINRSVATVISQVVVDPEDPRMKNPTKPVGPFYESDDVEDLKKRGYWVAEDAHRGFRRMVPSPLPIRILETDVIRDMVENGTIVIAVGGGGIPVEQREDGTISGVEAVVDKDWSASLLALSIGVKRILDLTAVGYAKLHFHSPSEKNLHTLTVKEAKGYLNDGHFWPGSMGPKIEAAIHFLENGGQEVIITSPDNAVKSLGGKAGTHIYPE
jgi:carbamate kinase